MSYLRRSEIPEGLPSIHATRSDVPPRRPIVGWESGADTTTRTITTTTTGGVSEPFVHRPASPNGKRALVELQEQLRAYKDDLRRKEELIGQLTSIEGRPFTGRSTEGLDETCRAEAAALRVKLDATQQQLRETQMELDVREARIREVKQENEAVRESEARQVAIAHALRERLSQLEQTAGSLEDAAGRSGVAVSSLQKQARVQQEQILELEAKIRDLHTKCRDSETKATRFESQYSETITRISVALGSDFAGLESVSVRIGEIQQENASMRAKVIALQDSLASAELEVKASRETIQRLVGEVSREQTEQGRYTVELHERRTEGERFRVENEQLRQEVALQKERLVASQRAWETTKHDLRDKETRLSSLGAEMRDSGHSMRSAMEQFAKFREELVAVLGDVMADYAVSGGARDECIKAAVRKLRTDYMERRRMMDQLEEKVRALTDQVASQHQLHQSALRRSAELEQETAQLHSRLRHAEGEIAANSVLRDGLKTDKQKYMEFLERLARTMKLDRIAHDVGLEMNAEALLARAEQLVRKETDELSDRQTHVYNLQRKVKALKEQLESKDLHLDLLRKKVAALEEKLLGRTDMEKERDTESGRVRKMQKAIERYQKELAEARAEARELKANLLDTTQFRMRTTEQSGRLDELERYVGHLEHTRDKQAKKIVTLKQEVDLQDQSGMERTAVSENAVKALSSELRTTKIALEEGQKREKQLLDLRQVLARMLGLDVNTLSVPDYEIISRLEKLVQSHTAHVYTASALDTAMEDMEDGFRIGYERGDTRQHRSPSRRNTRVRSPSPSRKGKQQARPRSPSPSRVDTRQY